MPWTVLPMSEVRLMFVHRVCHDRLPVAQACRACRIRRKTAYKWLDRHRRQPQRLLDDGSRRPRSSLDRTCRQVEEAILAVRDRYRWGARKIRAYLQVRSVPVPSIRTVTNVLNRHDRITPRRAACQDIQFFERPVPNDLWPLDFKGPIEAARRRMIPFSVLDDHSRYCLALQGCLDMTMATAWGILWDTFGQVGLPKAILCDNAFDTRGVRSPGISWFDSRLIRLGIAPIHGRPYHPQTQGKVESLHACMARELWPVIRFRLFGTGRPAMANRLKVANVHAILTLHQQRWSNRSAAADPGVRAGPVDGEPVWTWGTGPSTCRQGAPRVERG